MKNPEAHAASQAAWARVAILLNLRQVEAATTAAIEASKVTHWYRRFGAYQVIDQVAVYDSYEIPVGWMWMEPARNHPPRVLLNRDVISRFGLSPVMFSFASTVLRLDAAAFRWFDRGNWLIEDNLGRIEQGLDPHD